MNVHYVAYNGRHLAAIVIEQQDDVADLAVFTNMSNVAGKKNYGLQFHQEVVYNKDLQPGTWHRIDDHPELN